MPVVTNFSYILGKWLSSWKRICYILLFLLLDLWFCFKFKSHPVREKQYLKVQTHNMDKCAETLKGSCFKEPKDWKLFVQGIPQRKYVKSKIKNIKKLNSDFFSLSKKNGKSITNSSASSRLNWGLIQSLFWYLKSKGIWWECMIDYFLHIFNWVTSSLKGFLIFHTCLQTSSANIKFCSDGFSVGEKFGSYNSLAVIQ